MEEDRSFKQNQIMSRCEEKLSALFFHNYLVYGNVAWPGPW